MSNEYVIPEFRKNEDGSIEASHGNKTITLHSDGSVGVNLDNIKSIGIRNIVDLVAYSVNKHDNLVMHQFVFSSGAEGELVYTTEGKIKTFQTRGGCGLSISNENELILSASGPQSPDTAQTREASKDRRSAH